MTRTSASRTRSSRVGPTYGHVLDHGNDRGYWIFGHRGLRSGAQPGNTVEAFDAALAAGADGIEFDIRRTRDGTWLSFHDKTFQSGGRRRYIAHLDSRDLATRFTRLEHVLRWARAHPRAAVDLEVKDPGNEEQLYELVEPYRDQVVITSFIPDVLWALNKIDPSLYTGYLAMHGGPFALEIARMAGCNFVVWRDEFITPKLVETCRRRGMRMLVWDIDTHKRARELVAMGVEGFITDFVEDVAGVHTHRGRSAHPVRKRPSRISVKRNG